MLAFDGRDPYVDPRYSGTNMQLQNQPDSGYSISSGRRLLRDALSQRWKLLCLSILFLIGVSVFTAGISNKVKKDEHSTAIFPSHESEAPDIAQSDGATHRREYEAPT